MTARTPQSPPKAKSGHRNIKHEWVYGIIDPDYARVFTVARCIAWSEGYALMMHGSFTRDLDLLAVPWTESACEPDHLINRIAAAADLRNISSIPGVKPHGRKAWTLTFGKFGDPRFVDLSVMPLRGPARLPLDREHIYSDTPSTDPTKTAAPSAEGR